MVPPSGLEFCGSQAYICPFFLGCDLGLVHNFFGKHSPHLLMGTRLLFCSCTFLWLCLVEVVAFFKMFLLYRSRFTKNKSALSQFTKNNNGISRFTKKKVSLKVNVLVAFMRSSNSYRHFEKLHPKQSLV